MTHATSPNPYVEFKREQWRGMRKNMPLVLTEEEAERLSDIDENIDLDEVAEVYLPLSRLIHMCMATHRELNAVTSNFLGENPSKGASVPFIINVAGSAAVGKSTTVRLLQALFERWETSPRVDLVTTDGFLYPSEELNRRGVMQRKGYPESYDQHALMRFVTVMKSEARHVKAPVYSHAFCDRVPGEFADVDRPDIFILEGFNVLQTGPTLMISDLFDFSIYVDAPRVDIERWYISRFLRLRQTAFRAPGAYFADYATLDDETAAEVAQRIWQQVNLPNLTENILPTRVRASLVLTKSRNHKISRVRMHKL